MSTINNEMVMAMLHSLTCHPATPGAPASERARNQGRTRGRWNAFVIAIAIASKQASTESSTNQSPERNAIAIHEHKLLVKKNPNQSLCYCCTLHAHTTQLN
jgi:hypothetical protein